MEELISEMKKDPLFAEVVKILEKGGPGSGHFGHAGRPGNVGGSAPRGATLTGAQARAVMRGIETGTSARVTALRSELQTESSNLVALVRQRSALPASDTEGRARISVEMKSVQERITKTNSRIVAQERRQAEKNRGLVQVANPTQATIKATRGAAAQPRISNGIDEFRKIVSNDVLGEAETINVKLTNGRRANYKPDTSTALLNKGNGQRVVIHELAHGLEFKNPTVLRRAIDFWENRTRGEREVSLRSVTGINYSRNERTKVDRFSEPYMGKVYRNRSGAIAATEIVSMGLEAMWADPIAFASSDPEYFDFIYNLMRGN